MTLFPLDPTPEPEPPASADGRRTARNKALLARGVHPRTGLPLLPVDGPERRTCGNCAHHFASSAFSARRYHKCDLTPPTRGPATDVRVGWPACTAWKPQGVS